MITKSVLSKVSLSKNGVLLTRLGQRYINYGRWPSASPYIYGNLPFPNLLCIRIFHTMWQASASAETRSSAVTSVNTVQLWTLYHVISDLINIHVMSWRGKTPEFYCMSLLEITDIVWRFLGVRGQFQNPLFSNIIPEIETRWPCSSCMLMCVRRVMADCLICSRPGTLFPVSHAAPHAVATSML